MCARMLVIIHSEDIKSQSFRLSMRDRILSDFIKMIFIYVSKKNTGLMGLERYEGE